MTNLIAHIKTVCVVTVLSVVLFGCSATSKYSSIDEELRLSKKRSEGMKGQLLFYVELENSNVQQGERILFTAKITNNTDHSITLRTPKQSGVMEINHANTVIFFAVNPIDTQSEFYYPLVYYSPQIAVEPILASDFTILEPMKATQILLEIPNKVIIEDKVSTLPIGKYTIKMVYQNIFIGYEIEIDNNILYSDLNAWVGKVEAEPLLLTIVK
jgi:hypothetical protein